MELLDTLLQKYLLNNVYMTKKWTFIVLESSYIICTFFTNNFRLTLKNPFGNSKNMQDIIKRNISGLYDETHLANAKINNPLGYDLLIKML